MFRSNNISHILHKLLFLWLLLKQSKQNFLSLVSCGVVPLDDVLQRGCFCCFAEFLFPMLFHVFAVVYFMPWRVEGVSLIFIRRKLESTSVLESLNWIFRTFHQCLSLRPPQTSNSCVSNDMSTLDGPYTICFVHYDSYCLAKDDTFSNLLLNRFGIQ